MLRCSWSLNKRIFCDLDPGEYSDSMSQMEIGQSLHTGFWTIGLNLKADDCTVPKAVVPWQVHFIPLVTPKLYQPQPKPPGTRFTTVTQWYWTSCMEVDGVCPDFSKQAAFAPFMEFRPPASPEAEMELAVNLNADDPENKRLRELGWKLVNPHEVASSPNEYRRYRWFPLAEFTPGKGFHALWRTGWFSDRAAAYLATGRPAITDDTGVSRYLPEDSEVLSPARCRKPSKRSAAS